MLGEIIGLTGRASTTGCPSATAWSSGSCHPPRGPPGRRRSPSPGWCAGPAATIRPAGPRTRVSRDSTRAWPSSRPSTCGASAGGSCCGCCRRALAATDLITDLRVDYLPRDAVALLRLRALLRLLGSSDTVRADHRRGQDPHRGHQPGPARTSPRRSAPTRPCARRSPSSTRRRCWRGSSGRAGFADFREALRGFLAEYGHRETVSPAGDPAPTWGEEPAAVLGHGQGPRRGAARRTGPDRAAQAERRLLDHRLRLAAAGAAVLRVVEAARAGSSCARTRTSTPPRSCPCCAGPCWRRAPARRTPRSCSRGRGGLAPATWRSWRRSTARTALPPEPSRPAACHRVRSRGAARRAGRAYR